MLFPSLEGYDKKHQSYIIFFRLFLFLLPAKEIRLLGKFQPDSFKTERLVCVETDGQTDRRPYGNG